MVTLDELSWATRIKRLHDDPRVGTYTKLAQFLGVNQVSVIRWAQGTHQPKRMFQEPIMQMEKDGYGPLENEIGGKP